MDNNLIPPEHSFNRNYRDNSGESNKTAKNIISTVLVILAAPLIAIFLVTSVFQVYEVDGQSMEKSLYDNDRLIVLKTPKTWAEITNDPYIPGRYDIVVFNHTDSFNGQTQKRQLIKRVIALPGERIRISNGNVKVYNQQHTNGFLVDKQGPEYEFTKNTPGNIDVTVGENEVFLLGDNRLNSSDSRIFGTVDVDKIVGKLALRFYPFDKATSF